MFPLRLQYHVEYYQEILTDTKRPAEPKKPLLDALEASFVQTKKSIRFFLKEQIELCRSQQASCKQNIASAQKELKKKGLKPAQKKQLSEQLAHFEQSKKECLEKQQELEKEYKTGPASTQAKLSDLATRFPIPADRGWFLAEQDRWFQQGQESAHYQQWLIKKEQEAEKEKNVEQKKEIEKEKRRTEFWQEGVEKKKIGWIYGLLLGASLVLFLWLTAWSLPIIGGFSAFLSLKTAFFLGGSTLLGFIMGHSVYDVSSFPLGTAPTPFRRTQGYVYRMSQVLSIGAGAVLGTGASIGIFSVVNGLLAAASMSIFASPWLFLGLAGILLVLTLKVALESASQEPHPLDQELPPPGQLTRQMMSFAPVLGCVLGPIYLAGSLGWIGFGWTTIRYFIPPIIVASLWRLFPSFFTSAPKPVLADPQARVDPAMQPASEEPSTVPTAPPEAPSVEPDPLVPPRGPS